jgi:hypothetical protein
MNDFSEMKRQAGRLAVVQYQRTILLPKLQEMLALCPPIGYVLTQDRSEAHGAFVRLWDDIRKFSDSLGEEEETVGQEGGAA